MDYKDLYLEKESEIVFIKKENADLVDKNETLEHKNKELAYQLSELKRMIFGSKKERFVSSETPHQLPLPFEAISDASSEPDVKEEEITYTRKRVKKHPGRNPIPDHIPVQEIIIEPSVDLSDYRKIGYEITDTIDYTPGTFFVRRYIRPKYVKKTDKAETEIIIGQMPERPLPKAIAEPGLLAWLIVQKLVYHMPIYRQLKQFKTLYKINLAESTVCDWISSVCILLEPLYNALKQKILSNNYIQVDESPIKVLDKDKLRSTHQGYMWVYQSTEQGNVFFDYRKGRGKNGPKEILTNYKGYIQVDGYGVYEKLAKNRADIILVGCAAHSRRYFFKAKENDRLRAEKGLNFYKQLYEIERQAREMNLSVEDRQKLRQEKSKPILEEMKAWVLKQQNQVVPKSPIGRAITYFINHYKKLNVYLENGRLEIDNNLVENSIRPLALGRKNYLFAGSHKGAKRLAMMYSFMGTCQRLNINPYEWLRNTLEIIARHPVNKLEELLPRQIELLEKEPVQV